MIRKLKNLFHLFEAICANILYGFPSKKLYIIGITGTDGKTTTASLIYHILHENGKKAALISTVGAHIGGTARETGFHVTTPSPFSLQKYIAQAKKTGSQYLILEVTSHAIDQNRIVGIHFDMAVLTNITHEHLDYHGAFEKYRATKLKLFYRAAKVILNRDDPSFEYFEKHLFEKEIISYSLKNGLAHFTPDKFPFKTKLLGSFNRANSLAAAALATTIGINEADIKKSLSTFEAPMGRQQIVYDKEFCIINDFAHTPNAFLELLPEVKKQTNGKLIHVFGSAGARDASKRPFMGEAASRFDDIIVLTAEDPRRESIENIMDEIATGVNSKFEILNSNEVQNTKVQKNKKYLFRIPERKLAIQFAVGLAEKDDTVLLTGKGHEKSINYGDGEVPWDEAKVALEAVIEKNQESFQSSSGQVMKYESRE